MERAMLQTILTAFTRPRYWLFALLIITIPLMDMMLNTETGIVDDLPFGASFLTYLILLGRATLAVLVLHWLISYTFDTFNLDVVEMAKKHPEHNGLYMVAIGLMAIAFAIVIQSVISL